MKLFLASKAWEVFYKSFITQEAYKKVLEGLGVTIQIAVLGLVIGVVIGTLLAVVKVVPQYKLLPRVLSRVVDVYLAIFRGTPMVVQLLVGYYVLFPLIGLSSLPSIAVAILIFGLNSGAYVSEIMRAGIQSVDAGQLEAARALGMPFGASMMKVVIPQAVKNILPTLGNEFITLIKETSVVSFIAIVDLTKAFKQIGDSTYEYLVPYLMLAATYLVLILIITLAVKVLERRMKKSDRRN